MHRMHLAFLALHRLSLRFLIYMAEYDLALLERQENAVRCSRIDFEARRAQLQMELLTLEGA